jgi:hypothetical protein
MGYSLSWAAVKKGNAEAIHSILGLNASNTFEEIPESEVDGTSLPSGWYLVLFNQEEMDDAILKKLSDLGEVVYCFVEDHVMFSCASGWENGQCVWSVTHDCNLGRYHLQVGGIAPPFLENIRAKLVAKQDAAGGEKANVDYIYDVAAELAKNLTGFRHDQDTPGMAGNAFQVLEKIEKKHEKTSGKFLRRLFGRKLDQ